MVRGLFEQYFFIFKFLRSVLSPAIAAILISMAVPVTLWAQSGGSQQNYSKQIEPPPTPSQEEAPPDIEIVTLADEEEGQTAEAAPTPAKSAIVDAGSVEAQKSNETIMIRRMEVIDGDDQIQAAVAQIVASYLNRQLTMKEINAAAAKVTRYYKKHGYLAAKTLVPKQDASEGVLELELVLGAYGDFNITNNNSKLRDSTVKWEFERLKHSSPDIQSQSLERTLLILRQMPGGALPNVSLQAGKAPGTADLQIALNNGANRYQGYVLGDDEGSRYTGRKRLFAALNINSPFGVGDQFSVSGMRTEGNDLHNLRIAYSAPLMASGLRLETAVSRTLYALNGGSFSALNSTGSASAVEGTFSFPAMLSRTSALNLSLNIAHRDLHDDLHVVSSGSTSSTPILNPRTANVGAATVQRTKFGTMFGHSFYTSAGATVAVGEINEEDASEAASTGTNGDYEKVDVNLTGQTHLWRGLSAQAAAVMQKDLRDKTLDSSEELFISGSSGVRAFAEGMGGDNGYVFNLELPYTLPDFWLNNRLKHSLSVFFDSGGLKAEKNGDSSTDYVLNDVGGGYTFLFSPALNHYSILVKAQGVRILGGIHNETDKTRAWLQLGIIF